MRRRQDPATGSIDSLLDTMTNVVGILIVVVAVTQISVSETVKRIILQEQFADLNPEMQEAAVAESKYINHLLDQIRNQWGELVSYTPPAITTDVNRLISDLEWAAQDPLTILPRRQEIDILDKSKELEEKIAEKQEEIEYYKAQIEEQRGPPPLAQVSTIPGPKVAPRGKAPIFFICKQGEVYPFHARELADIFDQALRKYLNQPRGRIFIDFGQFGNIADHFQDKDIGDKTIRMRVENLGNALMLRSDIRESAEGETLREIVRPNSDFQRRIKFLNPREQVVNFLVWGDSFEIYLVAKKIAEKAGFQVQWTPFSVGQPLREIIKAEKQDTMGIGETNELLGR